MVVHLAQKYEGFRPYPYFCPAGIATIGYGATYYQNGERVTIKDTPITKEVALEILNYHIEMVYLPAVLMLCPVEMTDGRLAALTDFAFNCGIKNLKNSTLRRRVNASLWSSTPAEFRKWIHCGSKELTGLKARREAEIALL